MTIDVTTVIVARNAASTISRCVRSALAQGGPILLVDDFSSDGTAAIARDVAGDRLQVVMPDRHETLGFARQAGIDAVRTRFAMWVDADDELLPGRALRLLHTLEQEGADIAYDAADLYDGTSGAFLRHMPIPGYIARDPTAVRQFERNAIPSLGWPLVRTAWAQQVGYDLRCHGVEDYDFLLRSCMDGARVAYEPEAGYRQFAYATSVSRDLDARRSGVRDLLLKHDYHVIRARFGAACHGAAVTAWTLVAVALYRSDLDAAAGFLDEAAAAILDPDQVLEADGPCQYPEGWRLAFYRGTLALLTGRFEQAAVELERAQTFVSAPESSNNLGVVLARLGRRRDAEDLFARALRQFPAYVDAARNLGAATPSRITTHPLRTTPARSEYPRELATA